MLRACKLIAGSFVLLSLYTAAFAGGAVVVNRDHAPKVKLPDAASLGEPLEFARTTSGQGLRAFTDPSGTVTAVTAPMHVSDAQIKTCKLPDELLAAAFVERSSTAQLKNRKMGYLFLKDMTPSQKSAVLQVCRSHGLVDQNDKPEEKNTKVVAGIGPVWLLHLAIETDQGTVTRIVGTLPRPPSPEAIAADPLKGSVTWYAWPYSSAAWGKQEVSIPGGDYSLGTVVRLLTQQSGMNVSVSPGAKGIRVGVVAERAPLGKLLWAIEAATSIRVNATKSSNGLSIELAPAQYPKKVDYLGHTNALLPLPGFGYYSPSYCPVGKSMFSQMSEVDGNWIGWRLSDLPAMFRDDIEKQWKEARRFAQESNPPKIDSDHTYALWTKAILVSPGTQYPDGSGGGAEINVIGLE